MQLKDVAVQTAPGDPRLGARSAFLEGVRAAFVVSQMNRLGQVLCSSCGYSFTGAEAAFQSLRLCNVLGDRGSEPGYDPRFGWGIDNPNNLKLCCDRCLAGSTP